MFEKVSYLTLSDQKYPYKCDILVLEKIQDEYGDLSDFENKLIGFTPAKNEDGSTKRNEDGYMIGVYETPDIKTLKKALFWMVQEGVEIEAEERGKEQMQISENALFRAIDIPPRELGELLREEFSRCFKTKNVKPTQKK